MNELKELKRLLKFYDEARDNDKMTKKEQKQLCKKYAETNINKIMEGISVSASEIEFDTRNYKISCEYYGYRGDEKLDFKFFQNKCSIWDGKKSITLTIE